MRPDKEFITLAEQAIVPLPSGHPDIERLTAHGWQVIEQLTEPDLLDKEFPTIVPDTAYAFFSRCTREQKAIIIANDESLWGQAVREVALGMMDNPAYR